MAKLCRSRSNGYFASGEPNSFNILRCDKEKLSIAVERYNWIPEKAGLILSLTEEFRHNNKGWERVEDQAI